MQLAGRVNELRTARRHLVAQIEAEIDAQRGTLEQARAALPAVEADLATVEGEARGKPELSYLFRRRPRGRGSRTTKSTPALEPTHLPEKEATMARKSNGAKLEEVKLALRRAEKSAGTTKWALEGAGAAKNPPTPKRKKELKAKLAEQQARIAELRAERDALTA